ncbi:MAG: hypothetical protein K0R48_293 [Gammaproteobacteria bacterium]|jgi:type II secretory pathway pseudopilin PulG|nr:hypothetical protein [Gammaproteobacteria bacterium]
MPAILTRKSGWHMKGLTLLETLFALAISALVLVAAVAFYASSKQSANITKAVKDLNTIVGQTHTYMVMGGLSDLTADNANTVSVLQGADYLPSPMSDPWGQEYKAVMTAGTSTATPTTTITIVSLGSPTGDTPDKSCVAIEQALGGTATAGTTGCSFVFTL